MTSIDAFIADLGSRGVKIWLEGDRMRINAPAGLIDDELKAELSQRKPDIINYLASEKTRDKGDADKPAVTVLDEQVQQRLEQTGLSEQIFSNFHTHLSQLKSPRRHSYSLLNEYNATGSKTPLFLCIGYQEAPMIANHLGNDQPVYGMRQGNKMMENTTDNKQALARFLAREILDVQPEGPFILGGFCQGAKIMTYIARELHELGQNISLLIFIDNLILQPYCENLLLIFGDESTYFPHRFFNSPMKGIKNYYDIEPEIRTYKGSHALHESPDAVKQVADIIRDEISSIRIDELSADTGHQKLITALPGEHYRSEIRSPDILNTPFLTRWQQLRHLKTKLNVTVTNRSHVDWRLDDMGPLYLCCRWFQTGLHSILHFEICTRLPKFVASGESIEIQARLKSPIYRNKYRLEFDLMDQDRNWFRDHGGGHAITFVNLTDSNQPSS